MKSAALESGGESGRRINEIVNELAIFKEESERYKQLAEELSAELKEKRKELRQWEMDKTKLLVAQQRIKVGVGVWSQYFFLFIFNLS